jgi:hypothetical protein
VGFRDGETGSFRYRFRYGPARACLIRVYPAETSPRDTFRVSFGSDLSFETPHQGGSTPKRDETPLSLGAFSPQNLDAANNRSYI